VSGPLSEDEILDQAKASYAAGAFGQSRRLALEGLRAHPDNSQLLRLAGRSSLELDLDDAIHYLGQTVKLAPDDADAWRDLADACMNRGSKEDAAGALRELVHLRPDDLSALTDLAHVVYSRGQTEEAIALLRQVWDLDPGNIPALRSLVEMYRDAGHLQAALQAAREIEDRLPGDVVARLDEAQLNLALEDFKAAAAAYDSLRTADPEPQHLIYAYHGTIHVELRRANWRRALDHAIAATRVDRNELTTQLLAFTAARLFGDTRRETLPYAEIEALLTAEHLQHRRQHLEGWVPD
jgi:tetratricopeptide (TPR) repeat protein